MVVLRGLLVEPVIMEVLGACGADEGCSEIRCVFENQGPLPARGEVIIDTWLPGDPEAGRPFAGVRETVAVALAPGERLEHTSAVRVPFVAARTMVRCMPGYVSGGYPLEPSAPE